jgi:hypothetical protein
VTHLGVFRPASRIPKGPLLFFLCPKCHDKHVDAHSHIKVHLDDSFGFVGRIRTASFKDIPQQPRQPDQCDTILDPANYKITGRMHQPSTPAGRMIVVNMIAILLSMQRQPAQRTQTALLLKPFSIVLFLACRFCLPCPQALPTHGRLPHSHHNARIMQTLCYAHDVIYTRSSTSMSSLFFASDYS